MSLKPELFGKYILLDKVAMGGMAEVYRAKAPGAEGIGKIIALKRILPQFSANQEFIEMFKSEAKIAINLTQGNIAQIYEFGEEQNQFYLAMEFIDGRNLRQMLSRCSKLQKALTIEQCVFIIGQVANGLDYAHRCTNKNTGTPLNIIHRDMSPQNIMVSFEGEVKIIDFGIAKAESKIETTRAGILKGKFGYMSPEQAEGADLDARTDIFSLGIVLWELLSGERLFIAHNEVNIIRKIRECQIPSLRKVNPNVHEELDRITAKALAKDRSLRYQTASELHRDLSRFLYKVNAEFTPHDLVMFAKSLFKDDILEDRKRVMEYAKISFPSQTNRNERINSLGELSKTFTETNDASSLAEPSILRRADSKRDEQARKEDIPKNLANTEEEKEIAFDIKVDRVELMRQLNSNKSNPSIAAQTRPAQFLRTNANTMITGTVGNPFMATNSRAPRVRRSESLVKYFPALIIAVGVVMAASIVVRNPSKFTNLKNKVTALFPNVQTQVQTSPSQMPIDKPVVPPPTVELARLFIRTVPAGANISINGENQGTTPAEVTIPMHEQVSISLNRDGYLVYQKDYVATKTLEDLAATLQKAIWGYLDIEVNPSNAVIYVNGQKLVEKSPIRRYPVPAGKQLVVKAVNPLAGFQDEATVTVKQDTVKQIKLFPRKSK